MEYVSFGSFLITRSVNINTHTITSLTESFNPSKHTPLYKNQHNNREILQWRLLTSTSSSSAMFWISLMSRVVISSSSSFSRTSLMTGYPSNFFKTKSRLTTSSLYVPWNFFVDQLVLCLAIRLCILIESQTWWINRELILRKRQSWDPQLKNKRGKFFLTHGDFEPWIPRTQSQCAANEVHLLRNIGNQYKTRQVLDLLRELHKYWICNGDCEIDCFRLKIVSFNQKELSKLMG